MFTCLVRAKFAENVPIILEACCVASTVESKTCVETCPLSMTIAVPLLDSLLIPLLEYGHLLLSSLKKNTILKSLTA